MEVEFDGQTDKRLWIRHRTDLQALDRFVVQVELDTQTDSRLLIQLESCWQTDGRLRFRPETYVKTDDRRVVELPPAAEWPPPYGPTPAIRRCRFVREWLSSKFAFIAPREVSRVP